MICNELIKDIKCTDILGDTNVSISGVNIDSRKIKPGHLFVAIKGTQVDGHEYIDKAIQLGAVAVLCEKAPKEPLSGITYIVVTSTEDAVGKVATRFYGCLLYTSRCV